MKGFMKGFMKGGATILLINRRYPFHKIMKGRKFQERFMKRIYEKDLEKG